MEFGELIRYAIITLVAFFVVAPIWMSTIGKFTTQKRFAILMVEEKVITEEQFKKTIKMQQIIGVIFSILLLAIVIFSGIKNGMYAWLCSLAGILIGAYKSRRQVQYTSETVKTFKRLFVDQFDIDKLNEFVEKNF